MSVRKLHDIVSRLKTDFSKLQSSALVTRFGGLSKVSDEFHGWNPNPQIHSNSSYMKNKNTLNSIVSLEDYLDAENGYYETRIEPLRDFSDTLYDEAATIVVSQDQGVQGESASIFPEFYSSYAVYSKIERGMLSFYRRRLPPDFKLESGDENISLAALYSRIGSLLGPEERLLSLADEAQSNHREMKSPTNSNRQKDSINNVESSSLSGGFAQLSACSLDDSEFMLGYTIDFEGSESYQLRIRDLKSKTEVESLRINNAQSFCFLPVSNSSEGNNHISLCVVKSDEATKRTFEIWLYKIDPRNPTVYSESICLASNACPASYVNVHLSANKKVLFITNNTAGASEVFAIQSKDLTQVKSSQDLKSVAKRILKAKLHEEYFCEHVHNGVIIVSGLKSNSGFTIHHVPDDHLFATPSLANLFLPSGVICPSSLSTLEADSTSENLGRNLDNLSRKEDLARLGANLVYSPASNPSHSPLSITSQVTDVDVKSNAVVIYGQSAVAQPFVKLIRPPNAPSPANSSVSLERTKVAATQGLWEEWAVDLISLGDQLRSNSSSSDHASALLAVGGKSSPVPLLPPIKTIDDAVIPDSDKTGSRLTSMHWNKDVASNNGSQTGRRLLTERLFNGPISLKHIRQYFKHYTPSANSQACSRPPMIGCVEPGVNSDPSSSLVKFTFRNPLTPGMAVTINTDSLTATCTLTSTFYPQLFSASEHTIEQWIVPAQDSTLVPLTIVRPNRADGSSPRPVLLSAYGAYGTSLSLDFNVEYPLLLRRGWALAFAHIRGGGDKGQVWHEAAIGPHRPSTSIADLEACCEALVASNLTSRDLLALRGGSAAGVPLGVLSAARSRDLFAAVALRAPFVDPLSALADETLPLTAHERREWGDAHASRREGEILKAITPAGLVRKGADGRRPHMIIQTSYEDVRTPVWQVAKFAARTRVCDRLHEPKMGGLSVPKGLNSDEGELILTNGDASFDVTDPKELKALIKACEQPGARGFGEKGELVLKVRRGGGGHGGPSNQEEMFGEVCDEISFLFKALRLPLK